MYITSAKIWKNLLNKKERSRADARDILRRKLPFMFTCCKGTHFLRIMQIFLKKIKQWQDHEKEQTGTNIPTQ